MSIATMTNATSCLIERPTHSGDAAQTTTWSTVTTVNGAVQDIVGTEVVQYGGSTEVITTRIYFEGAPDVRRGDRITAGGRAYQVHAVRNIDLASRLTTVHAEFQA